MAMAQYQPGGEARAPSARLGPLLLASLAAVPLLLGSLWRPEGVARAGAAAFVGSPLAGQASLRRSPSLSTLRAAKVVQDAEVVGEGDGEGDGKEEKVGEEEGAEEATEAVAVPEAGKGKGRKGRQGPAEWHEGAAYPPAAYKQYDSQEVPDPAWFDRRKIDRHKVNNIFFEKYAKPKRFFPHELQPGDTVRASFLAPVPDGDKEKRDYKSFNPKALRTQTFDGVILNFRGDYHARIMTLRAMVGSGDNTMGVEMQIPIHSPLLTKIQLLRRGYIGRNKNAYFLRGMVGKRNTVPIDKARTEMDAMYASLREEGRESEVPEPEYPQQEWDRYPLPRWKQDEDDWDEEKYAPEKVDQRTEYELRVIAKYRERISPSGKYGFR